MAGLQLGSGIQGSVFGGGWPGYTGGSAVPTATTVPEGPSTITQAAYGVPGTGTRGKGLSAAAIGTAAVAALVFIWWSLPR